MKERKGLFKGYSETACWLPLTQQVMDASNMAINMSGNDDYTYCAILGLCHDMLLIPYVDAAKMPLDIYNRFFHVFVYVLEFVYGDPYSNKHEVHKKYVTAEDYFNNIKKHWNTNITKELQKVDKNICKYEK